MTAPCADRVARVLSAPIRRRSARGTATLCLLLTQPVIAREAMPQTPAARVDPRVPITLAVPRRDNWRCLMRGHLRALIDSMRLLAAGEYEAAALATEDDYGLTPDGAEYCREPPLTREASIAVARLPPAPPAAIPAMFGELHAAARAFAAAARDAAASGDAAPAWTALAAMAGYCNACHAAYRLD